MTKIVKGGKKYPFITGDDVVVTKNAKHPLETVDERLDEQEKEIDKLKSNLKYVYSYGGVGGKGSGGSGSGSQAGTPSLVISLNGHLIQTGSDNVIILNKPGTYTIEMNVRNNNGHVYSVYVDTEERFKNTTPIPLTIENRYRWTKEILLEENGNIKVEFYDVTNDERLDAITQAYIVSPHKFDVKFRYEFDNGSGNVIISDFANNEYFTGDAYIKNPFIEASFEIGLPNVTNISLEYEIEGADEIDEETEEHISGKGIKNDFTNSIDNFKIFIDKLTRNGEKFTSNSNTGTYTVSVTLRYTVNGIPQDPDIRTFKITLIPNYLYINVRNKQDLIYDTLESLYADEVNGIPRKTLPRGVYTQFYCKIYEGQMQSDPLTYSITFNSYDEIGEFEFNEEPQIVTAKHGVTEQIETPKPIDVVFQTPGVKKLVFSTVGQKNLGNEKPTVKYIYIKESDSTFQWYPDIDQRSFYFMANKGENTWSTDPQTGVKTFPDDWGFSELIMSDTSTKKTLLNNEWSIPGDYRKTTILSLGIQYSSVNKNHSEILSTYAKSGNVYASEPNFTLYSDKFFDKSIFIPTESNFNVSIPEQYHLVQIVRHKIDQVGSIEKYATYLYIDGKLESNSSQVLDNSQLFIGKIVLNNVNVIYNLINIQYIKMDIPSMVNDQPGTTTIDELIYQYYLAYKTHMHVGTVSESESKIFSYLRDVKFNGEDVITNTTAVSEISPYMPIPTMMFEYGGEDDTSITEQNIIDFKNGLFKGYGDGESDKFGSHKINLYWCNGMKDGISNPLKKLSDPKIKVNGVEYTGDWIFKLQGTSTMRNKIKNFSLIVETKDNYGDGKKILMSPNYSENDYNTFLPEEEWTIKADIADSAHANNTAVGKFVNTVCTKFSSSNGTSLSDNISGYIKNTLEGFPILMYFKIGNDVYYLGVYNFNMGRQSYYNLGYYPKSDMEAMKSNIQSFDDSPFSLSLAKSNAISTLAIGEIQENNNEFDFHQYHESVLFQPIGVETNRSCMYGKLVGNGVRNTLLNFTKSVAFAGAYCFKNIGKVAVSSKEELSTECVNRYKAFLDNNYPITGYREEVPDVGKQFYYQGAGTTRVWYDVADGEHGNDGNINYTFDNLGKDIDNLLNCISPTDITGEISHPFYLDFTSASEYYTICMAFGLVDSVVKNMNIKSWDGTKCYVAFYDMDCAFGEDNAGEENITYLAATDYWLSETNASGIVQSVKIIHDYWPYSGNGFDHTSSYLFAIVKYAKALLKDNEIIPLNNYPQEFWAKLRKNTGSDSSKADGELRNADYFMDKYFASGIGQIPSYLATLNYQVKYLYKGIKQDNDQGDIVIYLYNSGAFNGTRLYKVKDWLNRRLHFLDVVFNVPGIKKPICDGTYYIPEASDNLKKDLINNLDVTILSDAFSVEGKNTGIQDNNGVVIEITAPKNTPCIVCRGQLQQDLYILGAEAGEKNKIIMNSSATQKSQVLGSKEFTNLNMVDPLLTTAAIINSNNLEDVIYGNMSFAQRSVDFSIYSTSIKRIIMNIPSFSGQLTIDTLQNVLNGQSVSKLDVSGSGFYGNWKDLKNLKELNISSVNAPGSKIEVSGCPLLIGENCNISGSSQYELTKLDTLVVAGVSGTFNLVNTSIQTIQFDTEIDADATFSIDGDHTLTTLRLTGFKEIIIKDCPNLTDLIINEQPGKHICEKIILDIPVDYKNEDGTVPEGLKQFKSTENGVFDFSSFSALKTLRVSGSKAIVIKIPDKPVSIESFRDNRNLEFVDTVGPDSVIEITRDYTFYNCPFYGMRQSWWSLDDTDQDGEDIDSEEYRNKYKGTSNAHIGNYTRMCVSPYCTTLAHTFDKLNSSILSEHLSTGIPYKNTYGQYVYNKEIDREDAVYFINKIIAGSKIDNEYIETRIVDDATHYIIHDTSSTGARKYGDDCRKNIVSFNSCFLYQNGINYNGAPQIDEPVPDLSEFTSLIDISNMYKGTKIKYLSASLLSLPEGLNNNDSPELLWTDFIGGMEYNVSRNAFKNVSYRIRNFVQMRFTIKGATTDDDDRYDTLIHTNENDGYFDFINLMCPHIHNNEDTSSDTFIRRENGEDVVYDAFTRFTAFMNFSVNSSQYISYTNVFKACPNITTLSGFLNSDLSKSEITGALKECKNLTTIYSSFNHTGEISTAPEINLYDFFNWDDEDLFNSISELFTSDDKSVGFVLNKFIYNNEFFDILRVLPKYKNITKLSNIFSYCTIRDYNGSEIKLGDPNLENVEVMPNINNINSLFYRCSGNGNPLNIRRSFFKSLPNVTSMAFTFGYVEFNHMLTYDFFCKRKDTLVDRGIYVVVDETKNEQDPSRYSSGNSNNGNPVAVLHTIEYSPKISNMNSCFMGAKFVNCECWFDHNISENVSLKPKRDYVTYNNDTYEEYYKKEGKFVKYIIKEPKALMDTRGNFTNYVQDVLINVSQGGSSTETNNITISNHDIDKDLTTYYNIHDSYPFNKEMMTMLGISPTYCCLPPDLLYSCTYACDLTNIFADSNIIGVIPQHFVSECYNGTFNNMFKNVNILPNLIYHYNNYFEEPVAMDDPQYSDKHQKHEVYMSLLNNIIDIDEETISTKETDDEIVCEFENGADATVLFRDSNGVLKRRRPVKYIHTDDDNTSIENNTRLPYIDFNKSQFVYVPQGYTTNKELSQAFTFRYNLPAQVNLYKSKLDEENIIWPENQTSFNSGYEPDLRPDLWPYYTQYFFTMTESLNWDFIYNMNYPFINDGQDVSFEDNSNNRFLSSNDPSKTNRWFKRDINVNHTEWHTITDGIFNVFLNLCGKRDLRTGHVVDFGCPITKSLDFNVTMNSFVSGILLVFLNGNIFEKTLDAGRLLQNGDPIIDYNYGFSRNIILPNIINIITNHPRKLIHYPSNGNVIFYKFMLPSNFENTYGIIYGTDFSSNSTKIYNTPKYKIRQ